MKIEVKKRQNMAYIIVCGLKVGLSIYVIEIKVKVDVEERRSKEGRFSFLAAFTSSRAAFINNAMST